jgi:hypothetical protein
MDKLFKLTCPFDISSVDEYFNMILLFRKLFQLIELNLTKNFNRSFVCNGSLYCKLFDLKLVMRLFVRCKDVRSETLL